MNLKKLLLTITLPLSITAAFASGDIVNTTDPLVKTFITNSHRQPDAGYQNELRNSAAWQQFNQQNPNWQVRFNEENQMPHRAYGAPISLPFAGTAQEKATWFINNYLSAFNVPVNDLQLRASIVSSKHNNVKFKQMYQGLEVLFSDVYIKMTLDGKVNLFGLDCFNNINISVNPSISQQAAENFASANVSGINSVTTAGLKVLPIPQYRNYVFKLVYEIMIENTDMENIPGQYYTLVDANNGEVLYRQNRVVHLSNPPANTDVNLAGTFYLTHSYNPATVNPLVNLKIVVGGIPYNTDQAGYLGLTNTSPISATFSLEGLWSTTNTSGIVPSFTTTLNPGANNISFDLDANIKEMTAYNSVNIIHDYMKSKFPAFTDMDFPLPTNIDVAGQCNAFYNGNSINFYDAGGGCTASSTVADVCYHEYGHGINDFFYSSNGGFWANGAMGEGYADIWALGITESPILGIGFFSNNPTGFVRRYDQNRKVYPQDLTGEVHADGEIIAGAWWDVGINLADVQQMMDIYKETFYALLTAADGDEGNLYYDILVEALNVDDTDGNIFNGTPHFCEITSAFALHGITLSGSAASFTHTEVLTSVPATPITVSAVAASLPPGGVLNGYYKINGLGTWTNFSLGNIGGSNYSGTIPGQTAGTIVHYYLDILDSCGTHVGMMPELAGADTNPNIPYYVLVGFNLLNSEYLEGTVSGWQTNFPGDNATTGRWTPVTPTSTTATSVVPLASYLNGGSTMVQTGTQHTTGGSKCFVTGNGSTDATVDDIDGGKTTLVSSSYDLTAYTNPLFTYWRWYSNDQGSTPGTDYWQVAISNDGGSTWTDVEDINVSDHSWRRFAFKVTDYITPSADVKLRFIGEDANSGSLIEAALDDIELWDEIPTSVNENQNIISLSIYPNPAKDNISIRWNQLSDETLTIQVTDNLGRIVYNITPQSNGKGIHSMNISTVQFDNGIYFLKLIGENTNVVRKITVMN